MNPVAEFSGMGKLPFPFLTFAMAFVETSLLPERVSLPGSCMKPPQLLKEEFTLRRVFWAHVEWKCFHSFNVLMSSEALSSCSSVSRCSEAGILFEFFKTTLSFVQNKTEGESKYMKQITESFCGGSAGWGCGWRILPPPSPPSRSPQSTSETPLEFWGAQFETKVLQDCLTEQNGIRFLKSTCFEANLDCKLLKGQAYLVPTENTSVCYERN